MEVRKWLSLPWNCRTRFFLHGDNPPRLFVRDLRLAAAIHWYARDEVSMEKAALIVDLDRNDFLEALTV